jgi:hypothetical protein
MILFTTNGLELRVFDTGREIASKTLLPTEAARLASGLLGGLHDHLATGALRGPQQGHPAVSHHACVEGAERPLAPAHIERKDHP